MSSENENITQKGEDLNATSEDTSKEKLTTTSEEVGKNSKRADDDTIRHIKELREEAKTRRLESKALKEQVEKALEMVNLANSRVIRTELRNKASQMGILDLDILDLPTLDRSGITLDNDGNVLGIDSFLNNVKTQKPHLFSEKKSVGTSSSVTPPANAGKTAINEESKKRMMTMSKSEARKEETEFLNKFRSY